MPITRSWEPEGFVLTAAGENATFEEFHEANVRFFEDPRSENVRYQLIDLRDLETVDASPAQVATLGVYDLGQSRTTPDMRIAFIVRDGRFDDLIRAYAGILESSTWKVRSFTALEEARAWAESAG